MQTEMEIRDKSAPPETTNGNGGISILEVIERASLNPAVDVDKMRALLEMHEHVLDRNAEAAFNAAFAEMQSEMPEITERGEIKVREEVRSKYALFEDINKAVKPILQQHGFAVMFKTPKGESGVTVEGVLMHREGHRESSSITLEADTSGSKNGVQSIGSSVSYAKRYLLCALLNITTRGEDDDGLKGGTKVIDEAQVAELKKLAKDTKSSIPKLLAYYKIDKIENLPTSLYDSAVTAFKKHGTEMAAKQAARTTLQLAPAGEAIEPSTVKTITAKMEHAKLGIGDFIKRFGLTKIEQINRQDINIVLAWIIDPQNA
jgi:ERF superfamily